MENMHTDVRVYRATEFGDLLHKMSPSRIITGTSSTHKDMREVLLLCIFYPHCSFQKAVIWVDEVTRIS